MHVGIRRSIVRLLYVPAELHRTIGLQAVGRR
jgi:hypothetical protein